MVFDKTDTKLSNFINEAQPEDLSAITSQILSRVSTLEPRQQQQFIDQVQRDPQARRVFEKLQSH